MSDQRPFADTVAEFECPCGDLATVPVVVQWADRTSTYRYCEACADEVVEGGLASYIRYPGRRTDG